MSNSFESIIGPDQVRAHVDAADWRAAVEVVGGLLVAADRVGPEYVEAMKQAVVDLGPYMVIAPGVAMPHARAESGVRSPGIAVATLTEPVEFGHAANDPVDLVIGFAALDKNAHLQTLQKIVALLQDTDRIAAVRAAADDAALYAALT